jgi:thiol:disulfide interchange protein DsbC
MLNLCRSAAVLALIALYPAAAMSGSDVDVAARITATLRVRYPEAKVEQVRALKEWPGMYEVIVQGGQIAYSDANGDYMISGHMVDTRTKADLTNNRWNELHKIDFSSLPLDLAIKTVRGDGSRRIAVFADPDCPYCEKLEQVLKDVPGVTIYTFLYPLEIHPGAREKAVKIWCAQDRSAAWSDWMLNRTAPASGACQDNTVAKVLELGRKLNIDSTPTMFLADGSRINGAVSRSELDQSLAQVKTTK